ncbi:hypothetical protein G9A89_000878 [Geosiphon pyriformis]|nr:hypothetical protein G9A89_000878 [Geosiphon pyriformis]
MDFNHNNAFLQQFTNNNTSITFRNCFCNIKQETSETVMTYMGRFNKLLRQIQQLETNDYYSDAQILDQFIAELKNKLIKKVYLHALADLATTIRHTNSRKRLKATLQTNNSSNNNHKDINSHNDATKTILNYHPTTNLKIVIIVEFQDTGNKILENYKKTNKTGNNNNRINPNNQLVPRNSGQQRPNHYHTQPSYLTIPEESDFQQTALSESKVAAPKSNPSNHTIPPAQIAQNANLLDIFLFKFKANESPFLLSNAAVNEQKAITAMYTEAIVKGKPICLILDSESAESIITYQLMQQLKQNINRPAQTVIVTADDIKKTPVREIDDFFFTIDGITIPVKVLVMNAPQYQALVRNDWLLKTNANLNWKTQELKISYQEQYTIIPATCTPVFEFEEEKKMLLTETYMALGSPSNWAEETKQEIFKESRE